MNGVACKPNSVSLPERYRCRVVIIYLSDLPGSCVTGGTLPVYLSPRGVCRAPDSCLSER